jgi:hypothetical protein
MQLEALCLHHHFYASADMCFSCIPWPPFCFFSIESEEDADMWHEAIVTAAILFLSSRKQGGYRHVARGHFIVTATILFLSSRKPGGCRHVVRGHCDGRHFVSFL